MPTVAVITGLSAVWLIAAGAGALIVIVVHLIDPRRARRALFPWSALRFLDRPSGRSRRRRTIERWSTILMRASALACVLIAFDQPRWFSRAHPGAGAQRAIVIDVSASMSMPEEGVSRLDRARSRALELVRASPASGTAWLLIEAGASARELTPGLVLDPEVAAEALGRLTVRHERDDLPGAIAQARAMLGGEGGTIDVITDGQRPPSDPGVTVHRVSRAGSISNGAVLDVRWTPERPVGGELITLTGEVRWEGPEARAAYVEFALGDERARVPVMLEPGKRVALHTEMRGPLVTHPTELRVRASLGPDGFAQDDAREGTLLISPALPVARLGGSTVVDRVLDLPGSSFEVLPVRTPDDLLGRALITCAPRAPLSTSMEDALLEARSRGIPTIWVLDAPEAVRACADWCARDWMRVSVEALEGDHERTWSSAGPMFDDLRSALDGLPVRVRARVTGADASLEAVGVGDDGSALALLGPDGAMLLFDPGSEPFASSAAPVVLTHTLARALVERHAPRAVTAGFPLGESDPISPGPVRTDASEADPSGAGTRGMSTDGRALAPMLALGALVLLTLDARCGVSRRGRDS